jgi:hypothetical protein
VNGALGFRTDDDFIHLRDVEQTGGGVDRVAGQAENPVAIVGRTDNQEAGADAKVHGDIAGKGAGQSVIELADALADSQSRLHRGLRRVLTVADAKQRNHFVANELIDDSAVPFHGVGGEELDPVEQVVHRFRIELLVHRRVAGEVGEQHGQLPPFSFRRQRDRRTVGTCRRGRARCRSFRRRALLRAAAGLCSRRGGKARSAFRAKFRGTRICRPALFAKFRTGSAAIGTEFIRAGGGSVASRAAEPDSGRHRICQRVPDSGPIPASVHHKLQTPSRASADYF